MHKADYILRSLSKTAGKRWEHYVINRIIHRLNDPSIEFVCQQAIQKPDTSGYYLADLFFPQLGIYLEIDESQHLAKGNQIKDAKRTLDIVNTIGFKEHRIAVYKINSLQDLNPKIDSFIEILRTEKQSQQECGKFVPWDYEQRYSACPHLKRGEIDVGTYPVFRTHKEAMRCFGYNKGHYQRGAWTLPSASVKFLGGDGDWCGNPPEN